MVAWFFVLRILPGTISWFNWRFRGSLKSELLPPSEKKTNKTKQVSETKQLSEFLLAKRSIFPFPALKHYCFFFPHFCVFPFSFSFSYLKNYQLENKWFPCSLWRSGNQQWILKILLWHQNCALIFPLLYGLHDYDKSLTFYFSWSSVVSTSHAKQMGCFAKQDFEKSMFKKKRNQKKNTAPKRRILPSIKESGRPQELRERIRNE